MSPDCWVIEKPTVVPISIIDDAAGRLGVIESYRHSPFPYARFYFLTNLSTEGKRGGHAHKTLRQVLICLRGAVTITIRSARDNWVFRLTSCQEALVLPPGYWRDLEDFSGDALVGVLASANYDEADYIRDWESFVAWAPATDRSAVPYLDLSRQSPAIGHRIVDAIRDVVFSGQLIGGPEVRRFEENFAAYCGTDHAVGVGNGLQAMTLILRAAGIGAGDEVILPANSFIATALSVIEAGAVPVLVDVEAGTGLICPSAVRAAITERTAAIIPVHLYGHPADMDALAALADDRGILLLEDSCQAHGALYKGRRCGGLGQAAAFSFYPTKNLGAIGDAGAVTTSDAGLAAKIRLLGNYGSERKYEHLEIGTNSRLDPVQAATLSVKLPSLDGWNAARSAYAGFYLKGLSDLPDVALPQIHPWAHPVWHVFAIRVPIDLRPSFLAHMASNGIGTNLHYPLPIHRQPCFASFDWREGDFPVSERLAQQLVSLPLDPSHTPGEIERVIETVRGFFRLGAEQAPITARAA